MRNLQTNSWDRRTDTEEETIIQKLIWVFFGGGGWCGGREKEKNILEKFVHVKKLLPDSTHGL